MIMAFMASANAQDNAKARNFELSVAESYDMSGIMPNSLVSELAFNYKFNSIGAVGLSGLYSTDSDDSTWGVMANLAVRPQLGEKFCFIPSVGLGIMRGKFNGSDAKTRAAGSISVEARYNVTNDFFCGIKLNALSAGTKSNYSTMLLGVTLGIAF